MRLLISGSSGFVGSALSSFLEGRGHEVIRLVRRGRGEGTLLWDPEAGRIAKDGLEDFDAVIHLGGENIFGRWTAAKKRRIHLSRTVSTFFLSHILSQLLRPPRVFISASAVGFYGNRGEEILDESSAPGQGFLSSVCREWERATEAVANRGVRTLQTRFGVVIGAGGAVARMVLPYRLGLGGKLGSGQQWVSWIGLRDLVRAMEFCLHCEAIQGPVNFVSPHPVRQAEFAEHLATVLSRRAWLAQPAWLLKLVLGTMADEVLLSSQRVEPKALLSHHFSFEDAWIQPALQKAVYEL